MNSYYAANLLIYAGVDIIALLALNLQFGLSGIVNFSFIVFQSIGAYTAAVLSLPPDSANGGFQIYFGGYQLPFPIPWIGGAVAGGLLSIITNEVITNARPLVNGAAGLALVPPPFSDQIDPNTQSYQFLYVGITAVCVVLVFVLASRVVNSPYGRSLRAMREREIAAIAIGKNPVQLKMTVFILGGIIAGLSGAILVGFIQLWAPSVWLYPETIILFAAIIVGGRGNNVGAILGALLVPVGFEEVTRFIPTTIGPPGLIPALQWVAIGLLIIGFLWFRPDGVRPEPRRVFEGAPVLEDVDHARRG